MRNMVKLSFIASALVLSLISCSNDFPAAPEFKFCKFKSSDEIEKCESVHLFPERDCIAYGGEIVNTCNESEPELEPELEPD